MSLQSVINILEKTRGTLTWSGIIRYGKNHERKSEHGFHRESSCSRLRIGIGKILNRDA